MPCRTASAGRHTRHERAAAGLILAIRHLQSAAQDVLELDQQQQPLEHQDVWDRVADQANGLLYVLNFARSAIDASVVPGTPSYTASYAEI